jgi:hypothetical protein
MSEAHPELPLPPRQRSGFWKRQFGPEATAGQRTFDVLVGVVAPILALIFDPTIFKGSGGCVSPQALLGQYSIFAYTAIGQGTLFFLVWNIAGSSLGRVSALFSGIFLAGALVGTVLGVLILPLSLIGLMICIGILGFLPFLTALIYLRTSIRAMRRARISSQPMPRIIVAILFGILLSIGPPALAWQQVSRIISVNTDTLVSSSDTHIQAEAIEHLQDLNRACLGLCAPQIASAFIVASEANYQQMTFLETAYFEITGHTTSLDTCSGS